MDKHECTTCQGTGLFAVGSNRDMCGDCFGTGRSDYETLSDEESERLQEENMNKAFAKD